MQQGFIKSYLFMFCTWLCVLFGLYQHQSPLEEWRTSESVSGVFYYLFFPFSKLATVVVVFVVLSVSSTHLFSYIFLFWFCCSSAVSSSLSFCSFFSDHPQLDALSYILYSGFYPVWLYIFFLIFQPICLMLICHHGPQSIPMHPHSLHQIPES